METIHVALKEAPYSGDFQLFSAESEKLYLLTIYRIMLK